MKKPKYLTTTTELFSQLMCTLEALDEGTIDASRAHAVSRIHNSAQGWMNYELKKATTLSDPAVEKKFTNIEGKKKSKKCK